MNILITGSTGMLGSSIIKVFSTHRLLLPGKPVLDVTNLSQVNKFASKKIDMIFHLAALTDLSFAQKNPDQNYKINVLGTKNILTLAKNLDVPIVYISSAMVFSGEKRQYNETDLKSPQNNYGKTKADAEDLISEYPKHYIIRNGWSFGGGPDIDKKFVNKIYQKIKTGSTKLYGITDIYGNPTSTRDFSFTLKNIIESKANYGIYNVAGKGVASRFDVLQAFINDLGMAKKVEVIPATIKDYLKLFPTPFPYIKHEVLSTNKIERMNLSAMRPWREALSEYVSAFPKI